MPTIALENVSKIYKNKQERFGSKRRREYAVREVDLTIKQGEFVFVVGSRGSGKSTLLQLICGETKPSAGKVFLDDDNVWSLHRWNKHVLTHSFGRVHQYSDLVRTSTIGENLEHAALTGNRIKYLSRRDFYEIINKVLGLVGMSGVYDKYPVELSYGEIRRIELARAMLNSPPILILDEITNNLKDEAAWDILHLLDELNKKGTTVIMATHASQYVNIMQKRVITMVDGGIFGDVKKGKYGDVG